MTGDGKTARADGFAASIVARIPIPPMALLRQSFPRKEAGDVPSALGAELRTSGVLDGIKQGMRIAVTGGSRGIASYADIMRTLVLELKRAGAAPFIFPAMGSHGGATPEGQLRVLESLGITETAMGCPVLSSMETLRIDTTEDGLPVFADRTAWESDGIVLVNRVKFHTGFAGDCESGLVKMSVIGLGKQKGAEACHEGGLEHMADNILSIAERSLSHGKILFGVATVENAYDRVESIHAIPAERIVDEIGKNISGGGMDPHIVGRFVTPAMSGGISSRRLVVLDITGESEGSGIGLGRADLSTRRAFEKFNFEQTYPNALTSNVLEPSRIPVIMANDRLAIAAAIKTCAGADRSDIRVVRIKNSLEIEYLYVTQNLVDRALKSGRVKIVAPAAPLPFNDDGRLAPFP